MRLTDLSYRAGFLLVTVSYLKYRHLTAKHDQVKIVKFRMIWPSVWKAGYFC